MDKEDVKRGRLMLEALDIINGERQDAYGNPEDSFETIADYWTTYIHQKMILACQRSTEFVINSRDVAVMMALLKVARIGNGTGHKDSYVDGCAYIALAGDMARRNTEREE